MRFIPSIMGFNTLAIWKVKSFRQAVNMLSDVDFRRLLDILDRPWAGFRKIRKRVKKRVRRHMERLGCTTLEGYLELIQKNASLRDECEACLRVTISRFYRDRRLWDHIGNRVLPELLARFPERVNAWSVGCACGEEPYSLAMAWEGLIDATGATSSLRILATDVDAGCMERARVGRYPLSSLKEVPDALKSRWFQKVPGSRQWQIDPMLQKRIEWQIHDLFDPPPRQTFHLIFLRNNLLTYHRGAVLETAFARIVGTLTPGGVLILGSHERPPAPGLPLKRDGDCPWVYLLDVNDMSLLVRR